MMSPSDGCMGLYRVEESRSVKGIRDGAMRRRRRPELRFEMRLVPSRDGVPTGDLHPYRYMDEEEREALLLDSFLRILRESAGAEAAQPVPDRNVQSP